MGYAGDPNVKTPNLDRLAYESLNFQNAVSVIPVCTPYRASLMTGKYPTSTGMFLNDLYLPSEEYGLGEVLSDRGYATAYIGKWHLDGHGRHAFIPPARRQGFEYWQAAECDHNYNNSHYYEGDSPEKKYWEGYDVFAQTKAAKDYMAEHQGKEKPFALFLSYGTPHFPHHTAPEDLKQHYPIDSLHLPPNVPESMLQFAKEEAQGYYAHCEALDLAIGEILATLDSLGISDNTLLVFTSDHGEMLGSHGVRPKAKQVPLAESARVPLLLRYRPLHGKVGKVIDTPITTPDLFPTLFGILNLPIPDTYEGVNLSEVTSDESNYQDYAALYMQLAPFEKGEYGRPYRAIKTAKFTYVRSLDGPWLLFDDKSDPFQLRNLVGDPQYKEVLDQLDQRLWELLAKVGDEFNPPQWYLDQWNLKPNAQGSIPYTEEGDLEPQMPFKRGT